MLIYRVWEEKQGKKIILYKDGRSMRARIYSLKLGEKSNVIGS